MSVRLSMNPHSSTFQRSDIMRIFALELDNDIKGIERNENDKRCMAYIEAFGVP